MKGESLYKISQAANTVRPGPVCGDESYRIRQIKLGAEMRFYPSHLACTFLVVALSNIVLADPPPAAPPSPVFDLATPKAFPSELAVPLLVRELARQSLLIAARDELGLHTRDAVLRELAIDADAPPAADASGFPTLELDVHLDFRAKSLSTQLLSLAETKSLVSSDLIPAPEGGWGGASIADALINCEAMSRGKYLESLKQVGFDPAKTNITAKAPCTDPAPPEAENLLYQTTLMAPFGAIQRTHQAIYQSGESRDRLGALVRGYANLGQLTSFQWSSIPIVFTARSLLYAQRTVNKYPAEPLAYYHRAYAFAMAGLAASAVADLAAAGKLEEALRSAGKPVPPVPDWAALLEPFCKHDVVKLASFTAPKDRRAQLAALMIFVDVEYCGSMSRVMELGSAALRINNKCFRVMDGMMEQAGVASGHELSVVAPQVMFATLPDDIALLKPVPVSVQLAILAAHEKPDPVANLASVSKSFLAVTEVAEPSFALAGRILQETNFIHVMRRATFMKDMWGIDSSEYLDQSAPLIADHPLRAYVESLAVPADSRPNLLQNLQVDDPQYKMYAVVFAIYYHEAQPGRLSGWDIWKTVWYGAANTTYELESRIASGRYDEESIREFTARLLIINPYSAIGAAATISMNWPEASAHVDEWTAQLHDEPRVLSTLADRYLRFRKPEKAMPLLTHLVEIAPDRGYVNQLASVYLDQGDEEKWLATCKLVLKQPDYGLDQSEEEIEIAWHYMYTGRYDLARPWADASLESGSGSSMECDAAAAEYQGDFATAQSIKKGEDERYGGIAWYQWCKRTGRGDAAAAQKIADQWVAQQAQSDIGSTFPSVVEVLLLEQRLNDAKSVLSIVMNTQKDAWAAIHLALACAALQDNQGRESALRYAIAHCRKAKDGSERPYLIEYAKLLLAAGDKAPAQAEVDRLLGESDLPDDERTNILYFQGAFCAVAGDLDQARAFYRRASKMHAVEKVNYLLACDSLHRLGEKTELPKYPLAIPGQATASTQPAPDGANSGLLVFQVEGEATIYLNGRPIGKARVHEPAVIRASVQKGDLVVVRARSSNPDPYRGFACAFVPDKGKPYQLSFGIISDTAPEKATPRDFWRAAPAPAGRDDWSIAETFADAGIWNPPTISALPGKKKEWSVLGAVAPQ